MNQLTLKTVKNAWEKSLLVLDNPCVNLTLVIILILYSSKMFGNINEVINGLYEYTFVKLLVLLIIAYVAPKDTNIAILLGISYVMSLKNMNMESFFVSKFLQSTVTTTNEQVDKNNCSAALLLNEARSIYLYIYDGLNNIIKSLESLDDSELKNIIDILSDLNKTIKEVNDNLDKSVKNTYVLLTPKGKKNCNIILNPIKLPLAINSSKIKQTSIKPIKVNFCGISKSNAKTANDKILIAMSFMADNIQNFANGTKEIVDFSATCIGISSSISSLQNTVSTYLIAKDNSSSITDPNGIKIINALKNADIKVKSNITASNDAINKYQNNMIKFLCLIVNDKSYQNLINNIKNKTCIANIKKQLFELVTSNKSVNFTGSFKSLTKENILNPNANWVKKCPVENKQTKPALNILSVFK
jgi:hypothetical protein